MTLQEVILSKEKMRTTKMEHRHFLNQSHLPELEHERFWNHHHPGSPVNLGNSSFLIPTDSIAIRVPNSVAYPNTAVGMGDFPLPNFNPQVPNYMADIAGTAYDHYIYPHSVNGSTRLPPFYVQSGQSYNQVTVRDVSGTANPQMDYERATYKRKIPGVSDADRGNINGSYGAGSSSNLPVQIEQLQPKPMIAPQYWSLDPGSMVPNYGRNIMISSDEGSQRNVRSRHGNILHHEAIPSGIHSSSNMSHHFHPVATTSCPTFAGQWSHASVSLDPQTMFSSSEAGSFNQEIHSSAMSYGPSGSIGVAGGYNSSILPSRNLSNSVPPPHGPSVLGTVVGHHSNDQRTAYRTTLIYPSLGFSAEDVRLPGAETDVVPRYSRLPSAAGLSNERHGRTRNLYYQFRSFSDEGHAPGRSASEVMAIMDRTTFYDPMNLFDQHHDMRLDIDNMSYEELLVLEERIGNVSTGLSEEAITRCLLETIYCSADQIQDDQEEDKCAICLEAYTDGVRVGRLKCKHGFHAKCIKNWLSIKNACPICKVSAMEDISR